MPIHLENFENNLKLRLDDNPQLVGFEAFKRSLERDYFSEVTIRNCSLDNSVGNLVVEMDCNLDLIEVLFHLQKGTWGSSNSAEGQAGESSAFSEVLAKLKDLNSFSIDVEEFSIFLNDSSIIIKKIYTNSIEEQLANILSSIAEHYVHLTRGLKETPYEIYVPVFEDDLLENGGTLTRIQTANNHIKDYFGFWGLYFDSEEDAVIYDLSTKSIVSGDLYLLNH